MKPIEQIAYEAYCAHTEWKSLITGAPLPPWEEVKPEIKAAWRAAAIAVASCEMFDSWVEHGK